MHQFSPVNSYKPHSPPRYGRALYGGLLSQWGTQQTSKFSPGAAQMQSFGFPLEGLSLPSTGNGKLIN